MHTDTNNDKCYTAFIMMGQCYAYNERIEIMSVSDFPIFICFLIFIIWFKYERRKSEKIQEKKEKDFWSRESEANFSRRKNLDTITYIVIPYDTFPINKYSDASVKEAEELLLSLKEKRILNLTGKTSTELKLMYGAANLSALNEYDENFVTMIKTLHQYGEALYNSGHLDDAQTVLEFSVSSGSDLKSTYILLGNIYISLGLSHKIPELTDIAQKLDSLMKSPIINALNELYNAALPKE